MKRFRKANPGSKREAKVRKRALAALALMRREKLSLAEASRLEHIKPKTVVRYVGSTVRQDKPGGRYRAAASDRFRRDIQIPTALGLVSVPVYGSKNATRLAQYLNAVGAHLRKGDESKLKPFRGMKVGPRGREIELTTDPATLSSLALAGALQFDQLYASIAGA